MAVSLYLMVGIITFMDYARIGAPDDSGKGWSIGSVFAASVWVLIKRLSILNIPIVFLIWYLSAAIGSIINKQSKK